MKRRSRPPAETPAASEPFHNPFASLGGLRDALPSAPAPEPEPGSPARPKVPERAVVRLERKGRGGKEVTIVSHLALEPDELARWGRELKASLGCGGAVDGDGLVFQGDQREALVRLLAERGVRRVSSS